MALLSRATPARQGFLARSIAVTAVLALLSGCGTGNGGSANASASRSYSTSPQRLLSDGTDGLITAPGSATLAWDEPASREDGSRLYPSDISGYQVYYKLAYEKTFHHIALRSDSRTELSLSGFRPGVYDFKVTVVDAKGLESRPSDKLRINII